ncbi:MAG: ABC transporter ATP-binding protein/permease [Firmicutes bacterium]|nr:ABC transporter ATP-binding protein/permease [Bacillota bacterium]
MDMLLMYIRGLYHSAPLKFVVNMILMIMLGMLESISILMIVPLLIVAGIIPGMQVTSGLTAWLSSFLNHIGLTLNLPFVLLIYIGIIWGQSWLKRYQTVLNFTIQQSYNTFLTVKLFQGVAYADWQLLIAKTKSDITNVIITELMRLYSGLNSFLTILSAGIITLVQVAVAFWIAPSITCAVLVTALVLYVLLQRYVKKSYKLGHELSGLYQDSLLKLTEHLNGIKEIKSYGLEAAQVRNFSRTRKMMQDNLCRFNEMKTWVDMLYKVGAAVFVSLYLYSAIMIFHLNVQSFIVITVIAARLWPRISILQTGLQDINSVLPAFRSVHALETECLARENLPAEETMARMNLKRGVEFCDVSFRYDLNKAVYALEEVTFTLPVATTTAITGVSGSGKSTLVDLLMGLLAPQKGQILVDGEPLLDHLRPWRNSIGYVPQDAFLLNATIKENLLWACPDAAEEEMWEALRLASVDFFIHSLPDGLDTVVGDRGIRLSGGERQRIVLARALLRKPSVLILDEATSSLDMENEKRIQEAIEGLQGKMTIVIIAHRISTIKRADCILVLEQGHLVERGDYQSLVQDKDSRFHALAYLGEIK